MKYLQKYKPDDIKDGKCPDCSSKHLLYSSGTVTCRNCGTVIGKRFNKYGAKKTEFNGKMYDSKFEAGVAAQLDLRKRAGDIKDYDTQFMLNVGVYDSKGDKVCTKKHKVDFRVHETDGSYTLIEAKGMITADYQWRRDIVVAIFLSENPDYIYEVVKQESRRR